KPLFDSRGRSVIAKITGRSRGYWRLSDFTVGPRLLIRLAITCSRHRPGTDECSSLSRHQRSAGRVLGAIAVLMLTSAQADSLANWSLVESITNSVLTCVVYDGNAFTAAGADDTGGLILRSDDGASWSRLSSPFTNGWLAALAYGEGTYVTVGSQGAILRSTNGTTWTLTRMAEDADLRTVTFGHGFFMVGGIGRGPDGYYQTLILTSADGATWSRQLIGPPENYDLVTSLAYGD